MTEYVRVRLENGSHKTVTRYVAEAAGLPILDQDPLQRDGRPVPVKRRVQLGTREAANPRKATTRKRAAGKKNEAADASESVKED